MSIVPPLPPATELARFIEHTLLRADASARDIAQLCAEAHKHRFVGVCVNGTRVAQASALLDESDVKVVTVVGFPLGAGDADAKRFETEVAVDNGAHEIDVVLNIGRLKEGDYAYVLRELRDVTEAADERPVKVILETALLTGDEIIQACHLVVESGAKYVKTSTGFAPGGATVEHVRLLRATVGETFGVKASGGIRDLQTARAMIEAGANRIGTSAGVQIMGGGAGEGY
jgi:deoxyribose-phosphate aldolase